jgi:multiple sugar transport system ATP-binding protein
MTDVSLREVRKSFGGVEIIKGVDILIANSEFCVFVGPSGCVKSTLPGMIAGLEDITSGDLRIGGRDMKDVDSAERGITKVFQSYALYPHTTVRENIGFGLRMTGPPKAEIAERTAAAAEMLQLGALLTASRPSSRAAKGSASPSAAQSCVRLT